MNRYQEWEDRKVIVDLRNRFCTCYGNEDGSIFYIEPAFYTCFKNFESLYPNRIKEILSLMDELTKKNRVMVFTADEEEPLTYTSESQHAIIATMNDLADRLNIIIDDISRGSDYGD